MQIFDTALLNEATPSSCQRALQHGYRLLRFEPALEREFQQFLSQLYLRRLRFSAFMAIALYLLFVLIDFTTLPAFLATWTIGIRLGLVIPGFVAVIVASHFARGRQRLQDWVTAASVVAGLGTNAIVALSLDMHIAHPYEGVLLLCLFVYFITGLGWWRALAINTAVFVLLLLIEAKWQADVDLRIYHAAFMATANLLGAAGSYFLEYSTRTTFLINLMLRDMADHDGLTGLYNRRALNRHLERLWRQAQREGATLALAMIDVDHFKAYNDHYGHAEGDGVLKTLAQIIGAQALRPLDVAARYGGEEFVLIWYSPDLAEVPDLGERLRQAVADRQIPHEAVSRGFLTVTIGIALATPNKGGSPATLLKQADAALYQGKREGRNRTALFPEQG
jgi:diguanylate cyclase (GGDEF)-like protein